MGSVFNRGTRDRPNYYVKFRDINGEWKMRPAKGAETKEQAKKVLRAIERNVSEGKAGIAPVVEAKVCAELMQQWGDALTNRNARDDKYRLKNHLLPVFAKKRLARRDSCFHSSRPRTGRSA
jgi:hypothetical protein